MAKKKLSMDTILSNPTDVSRLLDEKTLSSMFDYCDVRYKDLVALRTTRNEKLRQANEEALQIYKPKTFPWKGAASVKYPLITNACIDFASRIFPAVWKDGDVVQTKYYSDNKDYAAGERLAKYLNYYLSEKVPAWPENLDKLATSLPINGLMLKKVYFDPEIMAVRSDLVFPQDMFVPNEASCLKDASFYFQRYSMTRQTIISYIRCGIWSAEEKDFPQMNNDGEVVSDAVVRQEDKTTSAFADIFEVVEGYINWDLDGDNFAEPYIVTFVPSASKVVRIVPRYSTESVKKSDNGEIYKIDADDYFVEYPFMQSPDGSLYALGLGELLLSINQAVDTSINQLLDAGTLNNINGGWISKNIRLPQGDAVTSPGRWNAVNSFTGKLSDNILPFPKSEPSQTTFQLLNTLIDAGTRIAGAQQISDIQIPSNLSATSSMAIIENGMVGLKSVYKRFHRALGQEIRLILGWIARYPDVLDYQKICGEQASVMDFEQNGSIVPVSDPNLITTISKATKAQQLMDMVTQNLIPANAAAIQICDFAGIDPSTVIPQEMSPAEKLQLQRMGAELDLIKAQTVQALALALRAKDQGIGDLYRADTEGLARSARAMADMKVATTFRKAKQMGDKAVVEDEVDTGNLSKQVQMLAAAMGINFNNPVGSLLGDKLKQSIPEGVEGVEDEQPNDVSVALDKQVTDGNDVVA